MVTVHCIYIHLLIIHIFDKILHLQDLFYQNRSSCSESENSIVKIQCKRTFFITAFVSTIFLLCSLQVSLVNYAHFWADYMTYSDACAWRNGMKLTDIGVHNNIKIYTKGNISK